MILPQNCYLQRGCKKYDNHECPVEGAFCIRLFKQDVLFDLSLLSESQRKYFELRLDVSQQDREAFIQLKKIDSNINVFVETGQNLYICSSITGNGKTAWATRLIQSYIGKNWYRFDLVCKALFINVPRYLIELKANISSPSDYIKTIDENVLKADLVVFDDIGSKLGTEYEIEHLLSTINYRIDNQKSSIFTSNILPADLSSQIGPRLALSLIHI